jgi:hypothetical protein
MYWHAMAAQECCAADTSLYLCLLPPSTAVGIAMVAIALPYKMHRTRLLGRVPTVQRTVTPCWTLSCMWGRWFDVITLLWRTHAIYPAPIFTGIPLGYYHWDTRHHQLHTLLCQNTVIPLAPSPPFLRGGYC